MTRHLSDIPTAELPALVEQGLPVSEYAAEIQRRRQPDCVFNVWGDGPPIQAGMSAEMPASWHLERNKADRKIGLRGITHRIRVFLKGAA